MGHMNKIVGKHAAVKLKGHQSNTKVLRRGADVMKKTTEGVGLIRDIPIRKLLLFDSDT